MILDKILEKKKLRLSGEMGHDSAEDWKQILTRHDLPEVRDFRRAIKRKGRISIIAEVKKASPSKGVIREDFDPVDIAGEYACSDVQAVSVLTEKDFFQGDDDYLVKIRQSFSLPILRKDFIIDLRQVYQSRHLGADAILLIVSALSDKTLKKFLAEAGMLGMECLVEVHNREELERALDAGAGIIGINNRNLNTFEVDLRTTEKLISYIPGDKLVISESGINSASDMACLDSLGVDAVLIGEAFMRAGSIREKIREIRVV